MSNWEDFLRSESVFGVDSWKMSTIDEVLEEYDLELLSDQGMFSYSYRIRGEPWVVKEGRWNVDLKLVGDAKFKVPSFLSDLVFKGRGLPRKEEVLRQYEVYLRAVRYLGFFDDENYWHPDLDAIRKEQVEIRDSLKDEMEEMCARFSIKHTDRLWNILDSDARYTNFLPKEYLLVGKGLHRENKDRVTSFIVQEYVPGMSLHDVNWKELLENQELRDELVVLIVLLLVFYRKEKLLVDTRPKHPATELFDWLMKTDNIFVNKHGFWLVDTRWCWSAEDDFVSRGLVIPNLAVQRWVWCLNRLLHPQGKGEPLPDVETFLKVGLGRSPFKDMRVRADGELRMLWERMRDSER